MSVLADKRVLGFCLPHHTHTHTQISFDVLRERSVGGGGRTGGFGGGTTGWKEDGGKSREGGRKGQKFMRRNPHTHTHTFVV